MNSKFIGLFVLIFAVFIGYLIFGNKRNFVNTDLTVISLEYDYIVIGAGSSGAVIASRLSEDSNVTVLLLEAGPPDDKLEIGIPLASGVLQNTEIDWQYRTVPQKNSQKTILEKRSRWPRGKTLGGSSSINYMLYVRGHKSDYDSWEKDYGCEGWSFKDVLPFFKKSENNQRESLRNDEYHGSSGPLYVSDLKEYQPHSSLFLKASQEIGIPTPTDYNGKDMIGAFFGQTTTKNGQRWSTADAFLRPVMNRPNLHIATNTHVTKVLFSKKEDLNSIPRAIGVEYQRTTADSPKIRQIVKSRKEVILSAGAIGSPHILLLSGIGPKEQLESFGIPLVKDLPGVGTNLQDHLTCWMTFATNITTINEKTSSLYNLFQWLALRKGPYCTNFVESVSFHKSKLCTTEYPDIQLHLLPAGGSTQIVKDNFGFDENLINLEVVHPYSYTLGATLLHPKSIGNITLCSNDPFVHPLIEPNYFGEELDKDVLKEGLKIILQLVATKALKEEGQTISYIFNPIGREVPSSPTDDFLDWLIVQTSATTYHPTSTCAMGRESDKMTVVNSRLKVKGIDGLRVADASIMPTIISGNTNAPSIMIGEKAADLIKNDNRKKFKESSK